MPETTVEVCRRIYTTDIDLTQISELPTDLGSLLKLALVEAKLVEKSKRYELNMSAWHEPIPKEERTPARPAVCSVCLAGSVMRRDLVPTDAVLDASGVWQLEALDCLRNGDVHDAHDLGPYWDDNLKADAATALAHRYIGKLHGAQPNGTPTAEWWRVMRELRDDLIAMGL